MHSRQACDDERQFWCHTCRQWLWCGRDGEQSAAKDHFNKFWCSGCQLITECRSCHNSQLAPLITKRGPGTWLCAQCQAKKLTLHHQASDSPVPSRGKATLADFWLPRANAGQKMKCKRQAKKRGLPQVNLSDPLYWEQADVGEAILRSSLGNSLSSLHDPNNYTSYPGSSEYFSSVDPHVTVPSVTSVAGTDAKCYLTGTSLVSATGDLVCVEDPVEGSVSSYSSGWVMPSSSNGTIVHPFMKAATSSEVDKVVVKYSNVAGLLYEKQLPSRGALTHPGDCIPCDPFLKGACQRGKDCHKCHQADHTRTRGGGRQRQRNAKTKGSIQRVQTPDPYDD